MTGLHLHRSERADPLVEALAALLATTTADPFTPEVVAVPARGVERWLTQRLSHHLGARAGDGVCANVQFPFPSSLVSQVVASAGGIDPDDDPWSEGTIVWTLLGVIDDCVGESWCSALGRHLGVGGDGSSWRGGRRFAVAQHLAGMYSSYAAQRPQLLRDWAGGSDTDGAAGALDHDLVWQAELWRRLRARVGATSPAERLGDACRALRANPALVDLPRRLSVFGPTRLTQSQREVFEALAVDRDVYLWLLHPSAAEWDKISRLEPGSALPRRDDDRTVDVGEHPLLRSLGRDAREMQLQLGLARPASDVHHRVPADASSLLGRLQRDLRADTAPPGRPRGEAPELRPVLATTDRSLQVHACHGRDRQVEVLREVLLGLLQGDATLEPRDVLVMCPDIESYAPFISATFGLADSDQPLTHPGHGLRVRLADRSLRQTNPLLAMLADLLELADARVTATQVLDLAASGPVSRRFGLGEDDLDRIRHWVTTAGVRWGFDAAHRAGFRMDTITQNTWRAGLDRILLGVTMSEDDLRWVGLAIPLDDVDSNDVDRAGRLAELIERLETVLDALSGKQPLSSWLDTLAGALDSLTLVSERDAWQLAQARRELTDAGSAAGDDETTELTLSDVRALLSDRLKGRPTRAGFRTGDLTMCSMVPMRSVPHRVICLLGLDDGVFPRTSGVDGDDVLARDPVVGERDRRSEDRQLLLDAFLAAQDNLVILYTGADERSNTVRPPAVPVGEMLDVVDATVRTVDGRPASEHIVVRQPLQPFDAGNFVAEALGTSGPFSFDRSALAGALASAGPRSAAPAFLTRPLPPAHTSDTVELRDLISFVEQPAKQFQRQRLGTAVPEEGEELDEALHAELGSLDEWAIGDRWLRTRLSGVGVESCEQAEWRRGSLPPGPLGARLLSDVRDKAEPVLEASEKDRSGDPAGLDVAVSLPDGRVLTGTVGGVHGSTLCRTVYSKLGPKHRMRVWIELLAVASCHGDNSWRAAVFGRHYRASAASSRLVAPDHDTALAVLLALVGLRDRGLCEPLPLPLATAHKYAQLRAMNKKEKAALGAAEKEWFSSFEAEDLYHAAMWGPKAPFEVLTRAPATSEDQPTGGDGLDATRFGALACQVWWPLLDAETLTP